MNTALWIVTGLLAVVYLASGILKMVLPKERIAATGEAARWAEDFSPAAVKRIGFAEVLGALGLVLPAVLRIEPGLVPVGPPPGQQAQRRSAACASARPTAVGRMDHSHAPGTGS